MKEATKVFESILIVEGSGQFPVDMMRYDACVPWGESDSRKISEEPGAGMRRVALRVFCKSASREPGTMGRWQSFGWHIVWEGQPGEVPHDLHATVYS